MSWEVMNGLMGVSPWQHWWMQNFQAMDLQRRGERRLLCIIQAVNTCSNTENTERMLLNTVIVLSHHNNDAVKTID